ncbi:MAG: FHA domain-containing protein [Euryarchaeota archaeon]|nr:FHA domain-containing protein [Euryarchaeota archaeon]
MGDLEKVVKKYLGDEEVIFVGDVAVDGVKIAKDKASSALFVNEIDDMKIELLDEGGKILIVVPNRDWYVAHPTGKDWRIEGGQYVLREWNFDYASGKLTERTITVGVEEKVLTYRAYSPSELRDKMKSLNLKVIAIFSDVDSEKYSPDSPVIYGFAEKVPAEEAPAPQEEVALEDITPEELKGENLEPIEEEETPRPKQRKAAAAGTAAAKTGAKKKKRARRETEETPGVYGLRLKWIDSNKKEHEIEIEHDIIIGRGRGDVLTISNKHGKKKYTPMMVFDTNKKISRKHLEIVQKDGKWYIRDLGSTNGTALNGTYLAGWKKPSGGNRYPSEMVKLRDGDIITLANAITIQANVYLKEPAEAPLEEEEKEEEVFVDEEFGSEPEPEIPVAKQAAAGAVTASKAPVQEKEEEFPDIPLEEPKKGPTAPPCLLKWVDGNLRPHEVEITDDVYIGKRKDNNVVYLKTMDEKITIPLGIIDLEDEISEKHLEIHSENGKWYIRDLGSDRGTIVRGDYLPGWRRGKPSEYVELKDDDEILIGKYLITVKLQ